MNALLEIVTKGWGRGVKFLFVNLRGLAVLKSLLIFRGGGREKNLTLWYFGRDVGADTFHSTKKIT